MNHRIVVLDGLALNPGDLSWEPLRQLGACDIYERTPAAEIVARTQSAEIILTNKTPLSNEVLLQLPALRYIGVLATGYNVVDGAAARARQIPVTNVPVYGTRSVAQHVFALLLELTQHTGHHAATVREGRWTRSPDWCYWDRPLIELDGLTLGIVGYGRIGSAVAQIGRAFGMKILVQDCRTVPDCDNASLDELLARSDVISLHCPLTRETEGLINAARLVLMKRSALLINTSRGLLIADGDLAAALNTGAIAGAAVDVLSCEPPCADNPLLTARNCIVTPHIAWATQAARRRLLVTAVDNVASFLAGTPRNVVN